MVIINNDTDPSGLVLQHSKEIGESEKEKTGVARKDTYGVTPKFHGSPSQHYNCGKGNRKSTGQGTGMRFREHLP